MKKIQMLALVGLMVSLVACSAPAKNTEPTKPVSDEQTSQTTSEAASNREPVPTSEPYASIDLAGEVKIVASPELPRVVLKTAKGNILIELYEDNAPNTVANFMYLVTQGYYKSKLFHRVEPGPPASPLRIVQGGSMSSSSPFEWTIKNEAVSDTYKDTSSKAGTIAMARTNQGLDTAGCQFFINIVDFFRFDGKASPYCVFGNVIEGMDVVETIEKNDVILDAWVVQKRDHAYIPVVKLNGKNLYGPVE